MQPTLLDVENMLSTKGVDRKQAIFWVAGMIVGLVLARALKNARLCEEILKSVRQEVGRSGIMFTRPEELAHKIVEASFD